MEKKKVVIVGPAYPYRGGQATVEASIFKLLTEAGLDCNTVTFKSLYPNFLFPGKTQYDESANPFYPHTEKISRVINSINPISWYRAYKKIKSLNAEMAIFVWWMPFFGPCYGTIVRLLQRFTKTKIVFVVENFVSHERRWFDKFFTQWTLKRADRFISFSQHINKMVTTHFPEKKITTTTLPPFNHFDLGNYSKETAREKLGISHKKVILYFGLIRKYKGLDQLIHAMKILEKEDPEIMLLAVGECYEDITIYEKLIEENELQDRIQLLNQFIPNEEVEPYFKAADVVCLPYYSGTQSGILMMAYGFGKPVVITDVGGIAELVNEKTGLVIENNEPKKIAEATQAVINNTSENYSKNIENIAEALGYKSFENIIESFME